MPFSRPVPFAEPGRHICVVGTSGSGKTYVAQQLASVLGLYYVCNDAIIWRAGWQETPDDDVYAEMDASTRGDGWTFDGNLGLKPNEQLVLARCDTIVWLDLPRWQIWSQVVRRTFSRLVSKKPLWHGNVERWSMLFSRDSIVWWSIKTFAKRRRQYSALFIDPDYADRRRIRLCSKSEVDAWLASLSVSKVT
jgi:adenylate kinase family enzyme